MVTKKQIKEAKTLILAKVFTDLQKTGRAIVRGLGTFKVVEYKEKVNNLGHIPARKLVKFTATRELKKYVNDK